MSNKQPAQEPVAWRYRFVNPFGGGDVWKFETPEWNGQRCTEEQPLYTAPPLRDLSDEQQAPVTLETVYETIIRWDENSGTRSRRELARRIVGLYAKARETE